MLRFRKMVIYAVVLSLFTGLSAGILYITSNTPGKKIASAELKNMPPNQYSQRFYAYERHQEQLESSSQSVADANGKSSASLAAKNGIIMAANLGTAVASRSDTGYIRTSTGYITAENVNLRSGPGLSSNIITTLNTGVKLVVLSVTGDWSKVKVPEGKYGWVKSGYIGDKAPQPVKKSIAAKQKSSSSKSSSTKSTTVKKSSTPSKGQQLVAYAKKYIGVGYVYGGESPSGFDCSGFVKYVYNKLGISIERVAASQATQGRKVSKSELKPGDLVFFDTNGGHDYINHVGMYIGGGQFIQASSGSAYSVTISDLTGGFYAERYMTARRFIN
jgi:N-acetylmuramoyl-L-alanine amidase